MSPTQLEEIKTELTSTIRVVVNGKINNLQATLDDHIQGELAYKQAVLDHIQTMQPVIEALGTVQSGRKFLLWVAPLAVIGSIITWLR